MLHEYDVLYYTYKNSVHAPKLNITDHESSKAFKNC